MNQGRIAEAGTYQLISRSLVAVTALSLVLVCTLGAQALLLRSQHSQALDETKLAKAAIGEAKATLEEGARVASSSGKQSLSAVSAFQAALVRSALDNGCVVREVATSADAQPYNSRFKKDTPPSDYLQVTFKAVLIGTPANTLTVLDGLALSPIPFEYDRITMRRQPLSGTQTAIETTIDLRVLARAGGA